MVNNANQSDKIKQSEPERKENQLSHDGLSIDQVNANDFAFDKSALGLSDSSSSANGQVAQKKGGKDKDEDKPLQFKGGNDKEEDKPLQFKLDEENLLQKKGGKDKDEDKPLQFKGGKDKDEDKPLQFKGGSSSGVSQSSSGALPDALQVKMEGAFGADFSNVKIHEGSSKASSVGALAYTQGDEIHFAPGQYQPDNKKGQELLGHELTHVIQQRNGDVKPTTQANGMAVNDDAGLEKEADVMGAKAVKGEPVGMDSSNKSVEGDVIQGYFETTKNSAPYRVADDLSTAVKVGYPNHVLYAKAGKAAAANVSLNAANSGIELVELADEGTFTNGKKTEKLKLITPKNKINKTSGSKMKLWADCGKSNSVVVGGSNRKAAFNNGGVTNWTNSTNPSGMKAEIMKTWLTKKYTDVNTSMGTKLRIMGVLALAKVYENEMQKLLTSYGAAKTEAEKETIADKYLSTMDTWAEQLWSYYYSLDALKQSAIDKELGINRYVKPKVGEGYTISTGGTPVAGMSTWNFHWGGVVMDSTDANDKIVLENYAVGDASVENTKWEFAMYGTSKKGQTFHDQHKETDQHGSSPTTMRIDNK